MPRTRTAAATIAVSAKADIARRSSFIPRSCAQAGRFHNSANPTDRQPVHLPSSIGVPPRAFQARNRLMSTADLNC